MATNRVSVAKDKADLVKALTVTEGKNGPFQTYADAIAFAASLGAKRKKRVPLKEIAKREPAPIDLDIFISRGYEMAMKLIAIAETKDPKILSINMENEAERVKIFEEYANGGLEILRDEFRGSVDYLEQLLLLLISERANQDKPPEDFDLSRFLT